MKKPSADKPWRFAVAGCGSIGKRHIKNLLALEAGTVLAFDVQAERRREVGAALGVETLATIDEVWAREPDVLLVTVPTALHMPLALAAAQRAIHLFIEKPLASRWEGVERLLASVWERDLVSLVGCNLRFHPGLARVKQLLDENAVGRPIAARVEVGQYLPDWHPWEDYRRGYSARAELGGGVILDAIHELDYIRWLMGEVTGAVCLAGKLSDLEIDTEDTAALLLRFGNGAIGEVHLDYVQRAYSRTCQIIGTEGTIHWDYAAGQVRWYSAHARQWNDWCNPPGWDANQMYLDEMKHFLACLAGEAKSQLDVAEAARVLRIALAAKESARERRWIDLTEYGKKPKNASTSSA
jgi:predicted dehydrogenase